MSTPIQDLLASFSESTFHLKVPDEFVARFFDQRRRIVGATKEFYDSKHRREHQTIDLLLLHDGTDLWGQSTIEENFALHSIVQVLKPRQVLEIGLFRGQTSVTLNQVLADAGGGSYTGIDISQDTIDIVSSVLKMSALKDQARLVVGDSAVVVADTPSVDFAFIDGDHNWPGVVRDVVNVYNKMSSGGVIAMHDVGTPGWGWCIQDPGRLLFEFLPERLDGHASIFWLDSMCRQLTMKLLSPASKGPNSYFTTLAETLEKARVTTYDTVKGWGGLGFILKMNGSHKLDLDELLRAQPPALDLNPPSTEKSISIIGRAARKLAARVP